MLVAGRTIWLLMLLGLTSSCASVVANRATALPGDVGSIAIDQQGNVYVAPDYSKWDADGHAVDHIHSSPSSVPHVLAVDEEFLYCAVAREKGDSSGGQEVQRFKLADGSSAPFTGPAPRVDQARGLDVVGALLYVADAAAGTIRMFDTTSGAAAGEFDVHGPQAVAVDPLGQIWVAHEHSVVQAFRADGYSGVTYGGLGDVSALTFGPGARLYAADAASGRVMVLDTAASPAQFVAVLSLGVEAGRLCAVAADDHGNLITLQRSVSGQGFRLAKYGADKKLISEVKR